MARTTISLVKEIINTALPDSVITSLISAASTVISEQLSGTTLSDTTLAEIERWFVAHMISSSVERMAVKETVGEANVEYSGKFGEGLRSTSYGQMVLTLDSSGLLAISGKGTIKITAVKSFD